MRDSVFNTFKVAALLCLVCSVLVSGAAVGLRSMQEKNKELDKKKNILTAGKLIQEGEKPSAEQIEELYKKIQPELITLSTGEVVSDGDPDTFDAKKAANDPNLSMVLDPAIDTGKIQRVAKQAVIYKVMSPEGDVDTLVLPIHGKGLWSTLYGFLAVSPNGQTVKGITYYQHAETPGLGGEVDNPNWKALWPGRKVYDENGQVKLTVLKGKAGPVDQDPYQVDGLSGATITARGVGGMIKFWMGENGYGKYFKETAKATGSKNEGNV